VTTEKFLFEFGFESLRDLPDLEAFKDAGSMRVDVPPHAGDGEAETEDAAEPFATTGGSCERVA
jgi:hypothetical protein